MTWNNKPKKIFWSDGYFIALLVMLLLKQRVNILSHKVKLSGDDLST